MLSNVAAFLSSSFVHSFLLSVLYLPVFIKGFHPIVCHVCVYDECDMKLQTASHSLERGCSDAAFRRSSGLNQRCVAAEQVVENCLT